MSAVVTHDHHCGDMADIRIGVRVSFHGRALRVIGVSSNGMDPSRVFLEDEDTGEHFVVTTRVLETRRLAEAKGRPAD